MAVTRAKATALLNATEMGLYDASRANALRGHTGTQLARLVTRARTARDRARDLEKRQKLALRKQTGSKTGRTGQANARSGEKAELLADILKRLDVQHKDTTKQERVSAKQAAASKATKKAAKKSPATKKAAAKKTATRSVARKATAKKTAGGKAASTGAGASRGAAKVAVRKAAKKAVATKTAKPAATKKTSPAKKAVGAKAGGKAAKATKTTPGTRASVAAGSTAAVASTTGKRGRKAEAKGGISPRKALANTRKLLEQQTAEARAPKPWQHIDDGGAALPAPGYQSGQAERKAQELHAAESRMTPIHGSISTRDRRNQGKRDHRNSED